MTIIFANYIIICLNRIFLEINNHIMRTQIRNTSHRSALSDRFMHALPFCIFIDNVLFWDFSKQNHHVTVLSPSRERYYHYYLFNQLRKTQIEAKYANMKN